MDQIIGLSPGADAFGLNAQFEQTDRVITRPPGGFPQYLSLFAVLGILKHLNAMDAVTLMARYSAVGPGADLKRDGDWNLGRICNDADLSPGQARACGTTLWLPAADLPGGEAMSVGKLMAPNLRICPECASGVFHAVVFQLAFVRRCPVHRCDLEERCPGCGAIRRYVAGSLRAPPYWCKCCSLDFDFGAAIARRGLWITDANELLADYLGWLTAQRSAISLLAHGCKFSETPAGANCFATSSGDNFEQFVSCGAAASAGESARLPVIVQPAVFRLCTFEAESRYSGVGNHLLIRGARSHDRQVQWSAVFASRFLAGHEKQEALELFSGVVSDTRRLLSLSTQQNHAACICFEGAADGVIGGRRNIILCPAASLFRQLDLELSVEGYVERIVTEFHYELGRRLQIEGMVALPLWIVSAELAAFQLHARIAEVAMALVTAETEAEQVLRQRRAIGGATRPLPFSAVIRKAPQAEPFGPKRILRISVLERNHWHRAWSQLCFCDTDAHEQSVNGRYMELVQAGTDLRAAVDHIRRPKS